jgi:hypothetical protein
MSAITAIATTATAAQTTDVKATAPWKARVARSCAPWPTSIVMRLPVADTMPTSAIEKYAGIAESTSQWP